MNENIQNNRHKENHAGWTPLLALVCIATTVGTAIPVGYNLGVLNSPAEYIKTWCQETLMQQYQLHLSQSQLDILWATVVSMFLVGGIFGSFSGAWLCNRFGRKGCLLISAALHILSGLLFNFCRMANSVEMLLSGRLLAGMAAALTYTAHPMYLLEIAPIERRSSVIVCTAIGVTGGIVVGQIFSLRNILGSEMLWQYALSLSTLFVLVSFLPCYWFPESPRWLYAVKQDEKRAHSELQRLRGDCNERVSEEMREIQAATSATMESGTMGKSTFCTVLGNSELMLPMVLVCSLQTCQQLSGINVMFYYSMSIFTGVGFSPHDVEWINLGAGVLNLVVSALGPLLMSKFNRRPMIMISCMGCGISQLGLAFALFYSDRAAWLHILCIAFVITFVIIFQFGLGPIPYFIGSELFEVAPRPVAMSMGSLFSWTGNFMIGMFFPILLGIWGSFAFIPCCLVCFYGFLLTLFYLPESRGREPAELRMLMKNGFKARAICISKAKT